MQTQYSRLYPAPNPKVYCCYNHFVRGRGKNEQTHCYDHIVSGVILPIAKNKKKITKKHQKIIDVFGDSIQLRKFGSNVQTDKIKGSLPRHLQGKKPKHLSNFKYPFLYSHNKALERINDLRLLLHQWKKYGGVLGRFLDNCRKDELMLCQLTKTDQDLQNTILKAIEERNQQFFHLRCLTKCFYDLVCGEQPKLSNLYDTFSLRLDKMKTNMGIFQDFLESFREFRSQVAQRQQQFDQRLVKASDIANFLAFGQMSEENTAIVAKWIRKFYKYLRIFKNQQAIAVSEQGQLEVHENLIFSYDELTEFLHYKGRLLQDQKNYVAGILKTLQEFLQDNTQQASGGLSNQVLQTNLVCAYLLDLFSPNLSNFQKLMLGIKAKETSADFVKDCRRIFQNKRAMNTTLGSLLGFELSKTHREKCAACQHREEDKSYPLCFHHADITSNLHDFNRQARNLEHALTEEVSRKTDSKVRAFPNVRTVEVEVQEVPIQEIVQEKQHRKRGFQIKYEKVRKEQIYKVKVEKHRESRQGGAKSLIFQEEKEHVQKPQTREVDPNYHCNCETYKYEKMRILDSDVQSTLSSVSEMQNYLMRLLQL